MRSRALDGQAGERLYFPLADDSGDRLVAILNRAVPATMRSLIVLVHGLTGIEDSFYMRESAAHFLSRGFQVLRLNLRGAGRSRPHCRTQYHAGSSDDLVQMFDALPAELTAHGVVAVGYSLGANLLLKYLGEQGSAAKIAAAAVVSAPLDLVGTARRFGRFRNTAYQRYLLRHMKAEAVVPGAELSATEHRAVLGARSVWEFDDVYNAPRAGYGGAADYYARTVCGQFLGGVTVPTLVVHALDDPWIPPEPYRAFDWCGHANLRVLLTRHGGHVGLHGNGDAAWHDLAIACFFESLSRP
ncbi:MAG: YheT family hydrolase [Stellaceae bacterium]